MRTAFRAAWRLERDPRRRAADFACFERLAREAAECPSRLRAPLMARDRVRETRLLPERPFCVSRAAWRFVRALPRFGGESFTPARRAFESPIAIACCGERAPCFPSRTWCISSRTNSPACVLGDLPSRSSSCAFSTTFLSSASGMVISSVWSALGQELRLHPHSIPRNWGLPVVEPKIPCTESGARADRESCFAQCIENPILPIEFFD